MKKSVSLFGTKGYDVSRLRSKILDKGSTYQEIADILKMSKEGARQLCLRLGINLKDRTARWHARRLGIPELEDTQWLLEQKEKNNIGLRHLSGLLKISPGVLRNQIERLGLDPEDFLSRKTVVLTCSHCGKQFRRPQSRIRPGQEFFCSRRCFLERGRGRTHKTGGNRHTWKEQDDAFIEANWQKMSDQEMAKSLGFVEGTVRHHRLKMNSYRPHGRRPTITKEDRVLRQQTRSGRLEVITGCMFSGKTEELIRRLERVRIAQEFLSKEKGEKGKTGRILLFKPTIDNRYNGEAIVTHYGREFSAFNLDFNQESISGLERLVGREELERALVIAFDEAQFFSGRLPSLCERLVKRGKRVIVAGLDLDFARRPFGSMPILMALADEVLKLHAVCVKCGKDATCTQRIVDGKPASADDEVVLVGGTERYEARCLDCYEI